MVMARIGTELEDRCLRFARNVHTFVRRVPRDIVVTEIAKQIARSSASIGANYIEANESFSGKDFIFRIRIAKKEARETRYWLQLIETPAAFIPEKDRLLDECVQLTKILGAILRSAMNR